MSGLIDGDALVLHHIVSEMRIDGCRHLALARLDVGEETQQRRQVVAFRKTLPVHDAFTLEDLIGQEEAVSGDEIDLGMVGPARQQTLQDTRRGTLADGDAARHADDIGHLVALGMQEPAGGAEQFLGGGNIEIEQARQGQIDRHHFGEIDAVIEAAQFIDIGLVQGHRRVGAQFGPGIALEMAVGRDFVAQ